ncbi:MAG: DNA internalization-related competence protein ComEC/Rec2 [Syntrophobacteraceae bacterium]
MGNGEDKRSAKDPPQGLPCSPLIDRPLLWLSVAFTVGIVSVRVCAFANPTPLLVLVAALLILSPIFIYLRPRDSRPYAFFPPVLFLGLGILAGEIAAPRLPASSDLQPFFDRPKTLFLAEVMSSPEFYPDKIRLPLSLHKAFTEQGTIPVEGGILLSIGSTRSVPATWLPGDRLLLRATLRPFHNFNNPGGYDYIGSQVEKGLYARAYVEDDRLLVRLASGSNSCFTRIATSAGKNIEKFRQKALFWFKENLEPDSADFYASLLLGYRIPKPWAEHLNRTGVTHLLSISGLHLGLVSMSVFWLCCRLIRILAPSLLIRMSDRRLALWPALMAAVLYALVSGLTVPTWRSLIMLAFFFGALSLYRRLDALTALAAAALVILLISPNSLRDISFQLTFAAMFGLFIIYPRFRRLQEMFWKWVRADERFIRKLLSPFVDSFWVSLAANLMVLPLTVYYFYGISAAGFAANTVLVPAIGFLVLPVGLLSLALFAVNEHLALPFLKLGAWFLGYCEQAIVWFSGLSWAYFWVGTISVAALVLYYAGMVLALSSWSRQRKAAGLLALGLGFLAVMIFKMLPPAHGAAQFFKAVVVDVGQGSSTLVQFPTGETMLIDGGGFHDDSFDIGRSVLAPFLWRSGIRKLDYVVLSHDHPDHRNGLRFILSHFDVGCFWETGITDGANGFDELAAIAGRRKILVRRIPEIIGPHDIGGCRVRVLHPNASFIQEKWNREDLNDVSLVLQIEYGKTSLIVPGDIDQGTEQHVFSEFSASSQVLLISPHHGSGRSNGPFMLDKLKPRAVIISCGFDNLFGFPSRGTIERCAERKIPMFRTDLQGAVNAVSDGLKWAITTESDRNINDQKNRER